uniref:Uncharacterized protein n=1 Tax=Anopheles atroparvus TaxID=41427 RepID=A0A182ISM7_ANOAO
MQRPNRPASTTFAQILATGDRRNLPVTFRGAAAVRSDTHTGSIGPRSILLALAHHLAASRSQEVQIARRLIKLALTVAAARRGRRTHMQGLDPKLVGSKTCCDRNLPQPRAGHSGSAQSESSKVPVGGCFIPRFSS